MVKRIVYWLAIIIIFAACGGRKAHEYKGCTPKWYLNPPTDPNYVYAVASGRSQDLQLAVNKAKQEARVDIASQIEAQVMALIKKFDEEVGGGEDAELLQQYTQTTKTVVDQTLMGVKVKEQKICKEGNLYVAYVLMEYPLYEMNKALLDQIKKQKILYTRFRAAQSFKELSEEIEKYREYKKEQEKGLQEEIPK